MKKTNLILIFVLLTLSCLATPNQKVIESFKRLCPEAKNVQWSDQGDYYVVHFIKDQETVKIWYNQEAEVVQTIRYYKKDLLPPFLKARVEKKFPGKNIFGITEIVSEGGVQYEIILEDEKKWYHLVSDGYGNMSVTKKLYKS
jgi:hypothetical protein